MARSPADTARDQVYLKALRSRGLTEHAPHRVHVGGLTTCKCGQAWPCTTAQAAVKIR